MKFPRRFKLSGLFSYEKHGLDCVKFEKGQLVATNGQALAIVPVSDSDGDADGVIDGEAIKAAQKGGRAGETLISNLVPDCDGGLTKVFGKNSAESTWKAPEDYFPDYSAVMPEMDGSAPSIVMDGALLKTLIDAIGGGWIRFQFTQNGDGLAQNRPIRVDAIQNPDARGCIMPVNEKA